MKEIIVEVAFATNKEQLVLPVAIKKEDSIFQAIQKSELNKYFPEYNFMSMDIGIFGKRIYNPESHHLKEGDRIEIYRPISKSPNERRLERAKNK